MIAFELLKLIHLLAFAGLFGTLIAQFVISFALAESPAPSCASIITKLETVVMPGAGALLLASGVALWALSGFSIQVWIVLLLVLWVIGFGIAHTVGGPALRSAALSRWRVSALAAGTTLIAAAAVAILKP
ncbi:hypothetical protein [Bradyrhizobium sp. S3.2.12]|uniref:hypothetical protein n=1 Tax=Bradyrhizobium sp. S3.2.12 TaxID=3156387 RepID=UPI00339976D4